MARLATLMREVSKNCAKWSPQPRSALLRAVESPTMKTVGSVGLSGALWGMLVCGGVGGGVCWAMAWRLRVNETASASVEGRSIKLTVAFARRSKCHETKM